MATITATQAITGVPVRGNHNGVDAIVSSIEMGAAPLVVSLSAGDVILWGRVPNGSTLLAIQGGGAVAGLNVRETYDIDGSTLGSVTAGSRLGFLADGRVPHTVSLSDDALGLAGYTTLVRSVIGTIVSGSAVGILSTTFYVTRDPGGTPQT